MRLASSTRSLVFAFCVVLTASCGDFCRYGCAPSPSAGCDFGSSGSSGCDSGFGSTDAATGIDGHAPVGTPCELTSECRWDLFCGEARVCEAAGSARVDATCGSTRDCASRLVCAVVGFATRCVAPGTAGFGEPCVEDRSCVAGLACGDAFGNASCASHPSPALGGAPYPPIEPWAGVDCPADERPARTYFDIPRGLPSDGDFYRLPYPNDARRTSVGLDLASHPHPAIDSGIDVVDRYLRAIEAGPPGFSTNPTLYFRFSRPYDHTQLDFSLELVDITPGSATYGAGAVPEWNDELRSRYLCANTLALRPPRGAPLRPGTTYAALISTRVRVDAAIGGGAFARAPDFEAMLAESAPTDAALVDAHAAYAPLRAYLADVGRDPASVLTASVFTTQPVEDVVFRLRDELRSHAAPTLGDLVVCGEGVTSPCDDGTAARACGAESPDFVEVHGRIALPIFQRGTAPYERPEDGGAIERDGFGVPTVARIESVCFALTVPRAALPAEGWPLLIHAHGEGESFRAAVLDGFAADLSVSGTVRAATLTIDLPQHGARRGASTRPPADLFYNLDNPQAARDNVVQGAADLHSLVYFATTYSVDAATSPTGEAIDFDATRTVLFARSQGATHASLMLPWEPELAAAVLSGVGGGFAQSLFTRARPIDFARLLPLALRDADSTGELRGGEWHPVLGLLQQYFDAVDPVNYARRFGAEPVSGDAGHLFMTYGRSDSYATEPTMQTLATAAGLPIVRPVLVDFGLPPIDAPLRANRLVGTSMRTQGLRQYTPEAGDDGHFVATRTSEGRADTLRFLEGALAGEVPAIGD